MNKVGYPFFLFVQPSSSSPSWCCFDKLHASSTLSFVSEQKSVVVPREKVTLSLWPPPCPVLFYWAGSILWSWIHTIEMCNKREEIICEFSVQSNAWSKSRIDGICGNDLPRRMTTLTRGGFWYLVLMLTTMTIMTLILTMAMMVMMMKCIEEYEIGKNDLPRRMTTLTNRRILISLLVKMVMIMRLTTMTTATTTMMTTMMMEIMVIMVVMKKWKAGVGPLYAKQLSLSISAATRNLKLEGGSCW